MQTSRDTDEPLAKRRRLEGEDGGQGPRAKREQYFENIITRDNARAQFGDQYHYHYYGPVRQTAVSATHLPLESLTKISDALKFGNMDVRRTTIKSAYGDTCRWLLSSPEYTIWLDDSSLNVHHGFLWIRGKPGAGKSTIMRLAVEHANRAYPDDLMISFFFNAQGDILERSVEGMYRALLYSLLGQCPNLEKCFPQHACNQSTWPIGLLENVFRDCILQLGIRKLICYIDALDECEESDIRSMVEFFESLGREAVSDSIRFRVCFASRHYPHVSISNGVHLVLDNLKGHQEDIETYVRSTLRVPEPVTRAYLIGEIRSRAQGIFLWVVLVVRLLNTANDRGYGHQLGAHLASMPDGLQQLFEDAIFHRGVNDSQYLLPTLLWMVFAKRQLTPLELYHGVLSASGEIDIPVILEDRPSRRQVERFILNSSKDLLEIEDRFFGLEPGVRFCHETVREYLQGGGLSRLELSIGNNLQGRPQEIISTICVEYISLATRVFRHLNVPLGDQRLLQEGLLRRTVCNVLPLLKYALTKALSHAETAQANGVSQRTFLEAFPFDAMIRLNNIAFYDEYLQIPCQATGSFILAWSKAPSLLQIGLSNEHNKVAVYEYGNMRCGFAALHGFHQVYWEGALHMAISSQSLAMVRHLLEHGFDVHSKGDRLHTPLEIAIETDRGDLDIVRLLLKYGADVNARSSLEDGSRVVHNADRSGKVELVRLLIEHGADVTVNQGRFGTPLQAARQVRSSQQMINLLTQREEDGSYLDQLGIKSMLRRS